MLGVGFEKCRLLTPWDTVKPLSPWVSTAAARAKRYVTTYNRLVNTRFGLRGNILPGDLFKAADESFPFEGFEIEVKDGMIAIGFDNESDAGRARKGIKQFLAWFSLKNGVLYVADLNQSWEVKPDNTERFDIAVADTGKLTVDTRVRLVKTDGTGQVVSEVFDTPKLATYSDLVSKSLNNPALARALTYYTEEVLDSDRPLIGVYKVLEELWNEVGGPARLAALVNQPPKYVKDVKQTAQTTRHARTAARQRLSDQECRERALILIEAVAKSI